MCGKLLILIRTGIQFNFYVVLKIEYVVFNIAGPVFDDVCDLLLNAYTWYNIALAPFTNMV